MTFLQLLKKHELTTHFVSSLLYVDARIREIVYVSWNLHRSLERKGKGG